MILQKGDTIRERLSLQGNPAASEDWWTNPKTGKRVDFIDFARSEGRFVKHFDKQGNPSELLLKTNQDRLENWRLLQELAGLFDKGSPATPSVKATSAGNGHAKPLKVGARIQYNDGNRWLDGVVESINPARLALEDDTEIRVTADIFTQAVAAGIVRAH